MERFFVSTPNRGSLNARIYGNRWREYENPSHIFLFNDVSLRNLLKMSGYSSMRRTKWLLNMNIKDNKNNWRILFQSLLQLVRLDEGLRFIEIKKTVMAYVSMILYYPIRVIINAPV